ncbi:unnamed protein product [Rotaria sordida]|uniref:Uncharacterized protein n=1 Tax=Rotaria sordida TaxID=392033 RepID=A0A814AN96_9BILA|nr:unnamed protein product [Rotaria sordida]CAF3556368.1 unnamed protein product [Rotaria sordida]
MRSTGLQPSTEEIMKFSTLFENELTLDNLDRPQLVGLCKLLGISTIGPDYFLRFTLHLKLRHLEADDKLIQDEGIDNLTVEELQAACRERGMRSLGVSIERLRSQLQQWLDLHLNKRIPSTILLLSRALYLPENIPQEDVLKAVIQSLPPAVDSVTAVKIAEVRGERVDNTQRIEAIKREDEAIRKEKEDKAKDKQLSEDEIKKKQLAEQVVVPTTPLDIPKAEILVDKAPILSDHKKEDKKDDQQIDVGPFETALGQLVHKKAQEVQTTVEEIKELKDDVKDYKEDVKALETLAATKHVKYLSETRSAKALSKRIDKLVGDLDHIVHSLDKKQDSLKQDIESEEDKLKEVTFRTDQIQEHKDFLTEKKEILVSTQELVNTIRELQKVSNQSTDVHVRDIINQFDHNKDGFIEVDEILKALEIIGNEKVKISKKHLKEIIDLMIFNEIIRELIKNIQLNVFYEHFTKDDEQIDSFLLNYLETARNILINDEQFQKTKSYVKIILEYSWEKLNTGIWQNVKDVYRYLYAYACYIDVLVDCRILIQNDKYDNYQDIIKKCDLGILLGGPILEKQFNDLISIINENCKNIQDEESNIDLQSSKRIRLDHNNQNDDFNWMPIPIIDLTKAIERIHCPSIEQFLTCYMQTKKPVILTGCMNHWPALSKWSFDYLIKLAGDRTVPIELGSRYSDDDWTQKLMTITDFVEQYCQRRSSKCGYLAQHPLLDQIPDLKKDICIPDYCYISSDENEDEEVDLNAWIGPKQTISPLHNDPKQNLLAQVVGEKYVRLIDPIYSSRLYALGSTMLNNTSSIDVEHPDYDRFPLSKDVPYLECILQPGEMLYMPSRHWHYMNFTELFKVTSYQCSFSPDGQYLACVNQYRLIIRTSTTLEILNLFVCIDIIDTIEWSYDSRFILAGLIKRNAIQIFSLDNPEWKCKIDEGSAGLCQVHWAPDSRHILTTAQFHLRITVWSLTSKNISYMKYPKKISPNSYIFNVSKSYMALVERRNDNTDHISIFNYSTNWSMIAHFHVKELEDLQGIQWSPNNDVLCLWENYYEYKIIFYTLDGQLLNIYKPENDHLVLGIRCAQWSPTGQIMVVGDYEEHITIFSYLTYKKIRESFQHPQRLSSNNGYTILKEEEYHTDSEEINEKSQSKSYSSSTNSSSLLSNHESKYIIYNGTLQIDPIKPNFDRANPRLGVSSIEFSSSGRYMSTINETMPNILFIFDFKPTFHLAFVLIQIQSIRCIKWEPKRDHLALCTHNNCLYIWSSKGASCISLPSESSKHKIDEIKWNNYNSIPSIALIGQNTMCLGFVDLNNDM